SREDQVDVWVVHQCVRQFNRRLIDPADQIFRSTGSDSSLQNDISRFNLFKVIMMAIQKALLM
ncbi:hypothetical protein, partial [Clostridioides difficile]|uniref:hypothetical protein n=1 Tax=Clostridioides difficile TaxID=1496 RepID=UPI003F8D29F9